MKAVCALPGVLAAVLVLASPAAGQQPPAPPAASQTAADGIGEARALMKERRYLQALAVLQPLAGQRPVQMNALFLIGLSSIGASQQAGVSEQARDTFLDTAIAALRRMLVGEPGLVRVRLELARAFFLKEEDRLATRHFEQVLAGQPPAAVALNINLRTPEQ